MVLDIQHAEGKRCICYGVPKSFLKRFGNCSLAHAFVFFSKRLDYVSNGTNSVMDTCRVFFQPQTYEALFAKAPVEQVFISAPLPTPSLGLIEQTCQSCLALHELFVERPPSIWLRRCRSRMASWIARLATFSAQEVRYGSP